jgi:FkbM family methyltransferase
MGGGAVRRAFRSTWLNRQVIRPLRRRVLLVSTAARGDEEGLRRHVGTAVLDERERRRLVAHLLFDDPAVVEFERNGLVWSVPTGDEIFREMFTDGAYERAELEGVLSFLATNRTIDRSGFVVDIGANVGTTTLPLVLAGFDVVAIEPIPSTFDLLERNVTRNGLRDRVVTVQTAIAPGTRVDMAVDSAGTAEVNRPGSGPVRVTVDASGLGGVLDAVGVDVSEVRFVWADTQGCELHVVRSGGALWLRGVPLFAEVWPEALQDRHELDDLIDEVCEHFAWFVTRDDLVEVGAGAPLRPMGEFRQFVDSIDGYSDALFLPSTGAGAGAG